MLCVITFVCSVPRTGLRNGGSVALDSPGAPFQGGSQDLGPRQTAFCGVSLSILTTPDICTCINGETTWLLWEMDEEWRMKNDE